jgi:hypothetical protein
MTTPHQSTAEAILAATGPLGFDTDSVASEAEAGTSGASNDEGATEDHSEAETDAETAGDSPNNEGKLSWRDAVTKIEAIDPRAAKLMRQMQGDYTRKTQEAAQIRKEAQAERAALLKGKAELEKMRSELPEYDPWNEDSIKARIEHEVQVRLNAMLEPMKQEYEVQQAEQAYNSFLQEHPEFETDTELRTEVQKALESNAALDLETAYWAVVGRRKQAAAVESSKRAQATRQARKQAAKATGLGRKGLTAQPSRSEVRKMSNADLLALAKAMHNG